MIRVVFAHGGTFDKFLGDAVMAFWGAPLADPDDAFRAVKAAVEMRDTFYEVCRRGDGRLASLGLGIGLNSGEAIVGNIGTERVMDYTVIGDTVNVSKRLQEEAASGEVLISAATYGLLGSRVLAEKRAAITLQGRQEPTIVYSVTGIASQADGIIRSLPQ